MNRKTFGALFGLGLAAVAWVGWGFVGSSSAALLMTGLIAGVYCWGARELWAFEQATQSLRGALARTHGPVPDLQEWLQALHPSLRGPVQQRIAGERAPLPAPGLTPYLVGLLVMLGMLGTFLGMVVTFQGAVFALEGSSNLDAMRAALAAPIKGLGLSFGTSVAGVASSAMLGMLSALCRRARLEAVRALDACIATHLQGFTPAQQRQELLLALQLQAQALPQLVQQVQSLSSTLEQRQQALGTQLQEQQRSFHADTSAAYQQLASTVGASLREHLASSAQVAGETIARVVDQALADATQVARASHQQLSDAVQGQQQALAEQWRSTAHQVSDTWLHAAQAQEVAQTQMLERLDGALLGLGQDLQRQGAQWLDGLQAHTAHTQAQQAASEAQRLQQWGDTLQALGSALREEWKQLGQDSAHSHAHLLQSLHASVAQCNAQLSAQAQASADAAAALAHQSQALVQTRSEAEARWMDSHHARMEALNTVWRTELGTLRQEEAERGQAAVQRLDALQAAVAQHLGTLGAALEAPLTRLLHTASEVPQAAAAVIAQLRQEMTRLGERDNAALAERSAMVEQVAGLLGTVEQASAQQRDAIDHLVRSATEVLAQAAQRFAATLDAQSGKVDEVGAHVAASAIELSSLGAAFGHGVEVFSQSNQQLLSGLQSLEGGLQQAMARSDEQLAYYVVQAREVVDLSITAQQGLVEDLRRLHAQAAGVPA